MLDVLETAVPRMHWQRRSRTIKVGGHGCNNSLSSRFFPIVSLTPHQQMNGAALAEEKGESFSGSYHLYHLAARKLISYSEPKEYKLDQPI